MKCPNCKSDIQDDFGLVTCANCGTQVLLSMDGASDMSSLVAPAADLQKTLVQEIQNEALETDTPAPSEDAMNYEAAPPLPPLDEPDERSLPATPDMSEVAAFGNSSASLAREGSLRFNIFISGIDSAEIRQQVLDALTDERFLWDVETIMAKSRNGELKISDVSAVKSSLIIQRLRPISIDIRWEQHAIHQ